MHLKCAKMRGIVVHENMKLRANILNNERLSLKNKNFWQYINNLETKRSYKRTVNLKNLNFLKNLSSGLKIIRSFVKVNRNVSKTANKSASIHSNQILLSSLLSSNRLELSPWSFPHVFNKIETTMRWDCMSKALRFLYITAEHQDCPYFTVFLTIKTSSQNISISCRSIPLKLRSNVEEAIGGRNSSRERFWKNSSQCSEILLQVK